MLNEKAMNIYQFIKESIDNGYPPTVREICSALNIKSTSTVHKYINLLVEEGYIEKLDNHNRAIKLKGSENGITVPVVGNVARRNSDNGNRKYNRLYKLCCKQKLLKSSFRIENKRGKHDKYRYLRRRYDYSRTDERR